jgi:hypothetical protein
MLRRLSQTSNVYEVILGVEKIGEFLTTEQSVTNQKYDGPISKIFPRKNGEIKIRNWQNREVNLFKVRHHFSPHHT